MGGRRHKRRGSSGRARVASQAAGGQREGSPTGESAGRRKLHGVITQDRVEEQVERTGIHPFTFSSALLIAAAVCVGGIVVPFVANRMGGDMRLALNVALPVLLAAALGVGRYFVDSRRGVCRGLWVTMGVTLIACALVLYLLLYQGLLL